MKRCLFLVAVMLLSSIANLVLAHKQECESPVHQHIAMEAFLVWPTDTNHEIFEFLNATTPWSNCEQWPYKYGTKIIEGAWAEDVFDPGSGSKWSEFWSIVEGELSNFNSHFWNCDAEGDLTGLDFPIPYNHTYWSAKKKAIFYWEGGREIYPFWDGWYNNDQIWEFDGIIKLYVQGNKEDAYFYLGRVVHLLTDMSVPAHVHLDRHPYEDDFEDFAKDNWQKVTHKIDSTGKYPKVLNLKPTNYTNLEDVFLNQAQLTQNFPSNQKSGNQVNSPPSAGWEWNLNSNYITPPYTTRWPIAPEDSWVADQSNQKFLLNSLIPLNMMYVANLYKLFWDTVHPFPTLENPTTSPDGSVALNWNNPENADQTKSVRTHSYRIYYGTSPNNLNKLTNPEVISTTSHTISFLVGNNTKYYFAVSAVGIDGRESNKSNIASAFINDSVSPSDISNFIAVPEKYSLELSWSKPSDLDFKKVLIIRSPSSISWRPTNGEDYSEQVPEEVYKVFNSYQTSCVDYNLSPGTTYYYMAFAYDEALNYSAGVLLSVTTDTVATATDTEPGNFRATTSYSSATLNWDPPININYRNYLLVRGDWAPSNDVSYNVGENGIVYKGNGTSFSNSGLSMGSTYHYAIFAYYQYNETHIEYGNGRVLDASTKLGGNLTWNLTLSKAGNPHIVQGMLTVAQGATLTIQPGAILKFSGSSAITVNGTLVASGSGSDPIYFTSNDDHSVGGGTGDGAPASKDWNGIHFMSTSTGSIMEHCVVKYAGYYWAGTEKQAGIYCEGAGPVIRNCEIKYNELYGIRLVNASPIIEDSIIGNQQYGIHFSGTGSPIIIYNSLAGNSSYGLYNATSSNVIDADYNWWGAANGPSDSSDDRSTGGWYNPAGTGARVSNYVNYTPWVADLNDKDIDGLPDAWEISQFGNITTANATSDYDGDGMLDVDEHNFGTDPKNRDSEGDGMADGWEKQHNLNPLQNDALVDSDNDGFSNLREYLSGSDPHNENDKPAILADFENDNDVDGKDLFFLLQEFGRTDCDSSPDPCDFDLDTDGDVDQVDLRLFIEDFGRSAN
jgi:hypothetical protein